MTEQTRFHKASAHPTFLDCDPGGEEDPLGICSCSKRDILTDLVGLPDDLLVEVLVLLGISIGELNEAFP